MKQPDISIIQNLKRVDSSPFPHAWTENALPDKIFDELEATIPADLVRQNGTFYESCYNLSEKGRDGVLGIYRFKSLQASQHELPEIWREFFDYHTSEAFFRSVIDLFEESISSLYPQYLDFLRTGAVATRDVSSGTELVTDCQFVINDPIPETFTSRTAHLDNPVEIYAALLYFKRPDDESEGGNLALYRCKEPVTGYDPSRGRELDPSNLEVVGHVPYKRNTLVVFLNTLASAHSVTPRTSVVTERRSVNVIGEFCNGMGMWEEQA